MKVGKNERGKINSEQSVASRGTKEKREGVFVSECVPVRQLAILAVDR